jgi:hypothetical protein
MQSCVHAKLSIWLRGRLLAGSADHVQMRSCMRLACTLSVGRPLAGQLSARGQVLAKPIIPCRPAHCALPQRLDSTCLQGRNNQRPAGQEGVV